MQAGRTAPSFSSFIPKTSDAPRTGKRSPVQRDESDDGKRQHSKRSPKPSSSSSRRKEHSTRHSSRKALSGYHHEPHGPSHRSLPSKSTLDSPRYLEESRTPRNYDLPDTGSSYYDDRIGSTSSLYLETRWYHLDGCMCHGVIS